MVDRDCPIDIVDEALSLACQLEVRGIPLDFDPGDLRWKEILAIIARRFSNHAALLEQLDDPLAQAQAVLPDGCGHMAAECDDDPCAGCRERWLAEYRLWEAALDVSEKAYQRWLARAALRRAARRE